VTEPQESSTILKTAVRSYVSFVQTHNKDDRDLFATGVVEKANQEWQEFHASCLREVTRLESYPTGQEVSEVYWRSVFLDYEEKLPSEYGSKFKDYLNWTSEMFKMAKEVIHQREVALSLVPFYLCTFATFLGWTFSKTLRRDTFLPRFGKYLS